ncbi:hypothetical membrane protein [Selenomonas ruminantium subsp. lactilytica TAM6421]|uniref:Hypothetical membrane protein n=1 Tax=Selenomonas ruminantium subsp. lactilytica (strain NBRC 103574 / TAM6421) TaxID=927704 RepID=I0GM98_SELRL|nr:DUF4234 domain-containing protein [Selenomonas ruminantium]BAL81885.1 hypothetical membrane protein [Selenomonas ruminantium subsp. lactilytica TAM6421]
MNMGIEKRSIAKAIILSFVTCGIYALYWLYKLTDELHELAGEQTTASGGMVLVYTFITCGIYSIYWYYKMGVTVNIAKEKRGMRFDNNCPIIYLLLAVFCLGLVSEALMQDSINDIIAYDEGAQA